MTIDQLLDQNAFGTIGQMGRWLREIERAIGETGLAAKYQEEAMGGDNENLRRVTYEYAQKYCATTLGMNGTIDYDDYMAEREDYDAEDWG